MRRAAEVQAANVELTSEIDLVLGLFRQAPGFMALLGGPDHVFQLANTAYEELVGRHDLIGRSAADALPEIVDQGFIELLDKVVASGEPFIGRGVLLRLVRSPGEAPTERYVDFIYQPYRDEAGEVVGVFVQGHDITEQKQAEQELYRQTEILRLAQDAGGFGTFEWDLASGSLKASPAFRRLYGFDEDENEIPVAAFQERVHPEDAAKLATNPDRPLDEALKYSEYRVRQQSGDYLWVGRQGTVLDDSEGRPARVVGAVHDITRRKQFEAELETLARESAHRVKNLLAIVQAIVSQTLRKASDINSASLAIRQRLMAIAATQTALTSGHVAESDLDTLVRSSLELHTQTPGRVQIAGPEVVVDGKTALGLTLVLHELGTNAVKYGALSRDAGRVDISWTADVENGCSDFTWTESGGPRVAPPSHQGFGSHLITRSLPPVGEVGSTVEYDPAGVIFRTRLAAVPQYVRRRA